MQNSFVLALLIGACSATSLSSFRAQYLHELAQVTGDAIKTTAAEEAAAAAVTAAALNSLKDHEALMAEKGRVAIKDAMATTVALQKKQNDEMIANKKDHGPNTTTATAVLPPCPPPPMPAMQMTPAEMDMYLKSQPLPTFPCEPATAASMGMSATPMMPVVGPDSMNWKLNGGPVATVPYDLATDTGKDASGMGHGYVDPIKFALEAEMKAKATADVNAAMAATTAGMASTTAMPTTATGDNFDASGNGQSGYYQNGYWKTVDNSANEPVEMDHAAVMAKVMADAKATAERDAANAAITAKYAFAQQEDEEDESDDDEEEH